MVKTLSNVWQDGGRLSFYQSACSSFHILSSAIEITAGRFMPFSSHILSSFSMMTGDKVTVIFFSSAIFITSLLLYQHLTIMSTPFVYFARGGGQDGKSAFISVFSG